MKVISVVGARPNFMKIGPLLEELRRVEGVESVLVHSGQHYDEQMSAGFFRDLGLPKPDYNLEVASGSHAWQTAETMKRIEPLLLEHRPDLVIVVGDVNTTLAGALTASKLGLKIAHVEAGLRSFDLTMPEEINRKLTDAVADFLLVTEESGVENLRHEGVPEERIFLVGNVMIDTLMRHRAMADKSETLERLGLGTAGAAVLPYAVLTLHRPSNVDHPEVLGRILAALAQVAESVPIYFPVHPRTRAQIERAGLQHYFQPVQLPAPPRGMFLLDPQGYLDFLCLLDHARMVLTDSGGIQEETTVLGVACLTLRENTERPVTLTQGTNTLVGSDPKRILNAAHKALSGDFVRGRRPALWDGKAAERIVKILLERLQPDLLPASGARSG
ncbi:MAG: non-hydrolyzing UDP-N-acetylglucosamine 2-epimerase [Terriglobales bacterium]